MVAGGRGESRGQMAGVKAGGKRDRNESRGRVLSAGGRVQKAEVEARVLA